MHEICCGIHETCMFHVEFFQQGDLSTYPTTGFDCCNFELARACNNWNVNTHVINK